MHAGTSNAVPDGTYERPYASLADALRDAPDGVWLLLRNGTYPGGVAVPRTAHVVAACRHRAVVSAAAGQDAAFTVRGGATLDLRDTAVRGDTDGVVVDDGGTLTAIGVLFDGLPRHAVLAPTASSTVRLEGCVVSGVAAGMPVADEGAVLVGGRAFVTGSHFTRLGVAALRANGAAASATIQDSAFLDTTSIAVDIVGGATARLARLAFVRNGYAAWSAGNATVEAADLSIADATPGPSGITRGVFIGGTSTVRIRGLSVRNAAMTGIFVDGRSAVFVERAAFVGSRFVRCHRSPRGTSECSTRLTDWQDDPSGGLIGASIQARSGASLSVHNAAFSDGEGMAIHLENGVANVESVRVERYAGQREGVRGIHAGGAIGVYADERAGTAALTLRGSLVANNTHYGLVAYAPGTSVVVRDSVIRDGHTPAWPDALGIGGGVSARKGATLRVIRSRVLRNELYNVLAGEAGVAALEDSALDDGRAGLGVGNGSGAIAQQAQVYAARCVFAGNQRAGVTALLGGRVRLERCVIRDTVPHPDEVAATLPEDRVARAGVGAYAWLDGHIELVESRVTANRGLGVGALGRAAGASLLRSIVVDQQGPPELPARGVEASGGSEVRLDACLLSNNEQISLNANGRDSRLSVVDSAVRGTRTHEATASGFGVQVFGGARAYLRALGSRTTAPSASPRLASAHRWNSTT
ncbi:MAG: right-handed parallel beta-helix repeat-containing protein [Polyangiales bacterium]